MYRKIATYIIALAMIFVPSISMADTPFEGTNQTAVWVISGIILIGIIALLVFLKKRENRLREEIRNNPEKYFSMEQRPDDMELTLTCSRCKKQYQIYVNPKDASFVRKNRERCPECEISMRGMMHNASGRTCWF